MKQLRLFGRQFRVSRIGYALLILCWLALVIFLPRRESNITAVMGGVPLGIAYLRWASNPDDPDGRPDWGCYFHYPMRQTKIKFSPEIEARIAEAKDRRTLLRAAQPGVSETSPQELLRGSENKNE